ncbi:hypothetical protein JW998_14855, partial [candidate division KSB1 bacterium]|nr:hypothetical protein [candidate division KSB1 bacterium]
MIFALNVNGLENNPDSAVTVDICKKGAELIATILSRAENTRNPGAAFGRNQKHINRRGRRESQRKRSEIGQCFCESRRPRIFIKTFYSNQLNILYFLFFLHFNLTQR